MAEARRALITGISGQDGSYLTELLLDKGYEVHGMVRGSAREAFGHLASLHERVTLHSGDLLDPSSLIEVLRSCEPHEIYNLAARSVVSESWNQPVLTGEFSGIGVTRLMEAIRVVVPEARVYQASSSEMFGVVDEKPQNENTPLRPRTPYGIAKAYGHFIVVNYRETYGLYACSGICYNHESPRRPLDFVTRKVSHGAAAIKLGLSDELALGDLGAERDWGYAQDYVEAMWLMLQQDEPDDYVIATGQSHSVRDLVQSAFQRVGVEPDRYVRSDPLFLRPADVVNLVGDPSKARERLGWEAHTSFDELVGLMVDADLERLASAIAR